MTQTKTLRRNVMQAKTLPELLDALQAMDRAYRAARRDGTVEWHIPSAEEWCGVDITSLPTFGAEPDMIPEGVWSWDANDLLVGEGAFSTWRIVPRQDAK